MACHDAGGWLLNPAPADAGANRMSRVDYEVAGREAHRFEFGDDEFFRVELYDGYFSLAWSTSLPIDTVLRRVAPILQSAEGEAFVFDARRHAHTKLGADEAIDRLRIGDGDLSFARLELPEATLVWEQPAAHEGEAPALNELAVLARVFDEAACVRMLRVTGTSHIARDADTIVEGLAYIAEHIARGRLAATPTDR